MRMRRNHVLAALPLVGLALVLVFFVRRPALDVQTLLSADPGQGPCSPVTVVHPPDGALFPPDIAPPTFHWSAEGLTCDTWAIRLRFQDDQNDIEAGLTRRSYHAHRDSSKPSSQTISAHQTPLSRERIARARDHRNDPCDPDDGGVEDTLAG